MNDNCLAGLACPECKQEDRLDIVGTAVFYVHDDGTDGHGDIEWDADSPCYCPECQHQGTVKDFRAS